MIGVPVFESKIFSTQIFFGPKIFGDTNNFSPKPFFILTEFFLDQKLFLIEKFCQKLSGAQILLNPIKYVDKNVSYLQIVFGVTYILLEPKIFD